MEWGRWGVRFVTAAPVEVKGLGRLGGAGRTPGGRWQARDWRGRWIPMGGRVQLRGRNRRGTVTGVPASQRVTVTWDDGGKSTVHAHMLRTLPADAPPPTPRPRTGQGGGRGGAPMVKDLVPVHGQPWDKDAAEAGLRQLVEGRDFAGYQIRVFDVVGRDANDGSAYLYWMGTVLDSDGNPAGTLMRRWNREADGTLTAENDVQELDPEHRGKGFAPASGAYLEQLYAESGFKRIDVYAASTDGGYTWASAGFDFINDFEAEARLEALQAEQEALIQQRDTWQGPADDPRLERIVSEIAAAEQLLQRWRRFSFGEPGFPTAREISQTGRRPGENIRDHTWIGLRAMRGSTWEGAKWLQ